MDENQVSSIREQVFGTGNQSTTQPKQPAPVNETPENVEPIATTDEPIADTTTVVEIKEDSQPIVEEKIIENKPIDFNSLLKERLGFDDEETVKLALAELKQLKEVPPTESKLNEQSKKILDYLKEDKIDELRDFLNTKKELSSTEKLSSEEILKLHIKQSNKDYSKADIKDVFEEKYALPEKPVQYDNELDEDFEKRTEKYTESVEKVNRKIERDARVAKEELSKINTELNLSDIVSKNEPVVNEDYELIKQQQEKLQKVSIETRDAYLKFSPKDIGMKFKFNDEARKLEFDINYEPDKASFDSAIALAADGNSFWDSYKGKDGSPDRKQFLKDLYAGRNVNKIVSEAVKQAVNETTKNILAKQKNIGDSIQRNYMPIQPDKIQELKQKVFG